MKNNKILWFDTETTGLDPQKNSIIQIAGIVEINGEVKDEFNLKSNIFDDTEVTQESLNVHNISIEIIKSFPKPQLVKRTLTNILEKYIDKYDKTDKFIPAGYNVAFDISMLNSFFFKCGDNYLGSYIERRRAIDVMSLANYCRIKNIFDTETARLENTAKHFGITIQAHDAMSDITATRELFYILDKQLRYHYLVFRR